jgi:NADPH:quinone reductase-like Zn-dependent oxidoreductase
MRAARLTDDHVSKVVKSADPAPQPDELVVRVRACGICGSDLRAHTFVPAGSVLSHEFSGEVVAGKRGLLAPADLNRRPKAVGGAMSERFAGATELDVDGGEVAKL